MALITLTIQTGMRLHFFLNVGVYQRYFSGRLNNKEKLMLNLIKDLVWRAKFLDSGDSDLIKSSVELEADVDENLANALKALMKLRAIRTKDLERLKSLPVKDACRELVAMALFQ